MRRLKKNEILTGSFLTAGFAMLTLLIVFALNSFFPFGNGSIIAVDLNSQYTPLLYRFYDVVTGAKHIAIDFHIGGGINLYTDTLTELLNPFNYCLLLFKRAYIYKAVNILLLMYVMAASVTAYIALTKVTDGLHNAVRIALSLTYSLSYFVAYQYEIIRWMYIVVLFPFVFLAIKRLLEKNKPLLFCLMLAYILILSLQLGIQICIFSFIYFACYIWKNRKEKDAKHLCLMVGLSFVSALLMSAVSTLPTVINLLGSARSTQSASILTVIESHGLDNILERILEISNPVVVGLFIAFILSAGKKGLSALKKQEEMVSLIILIATVLLEPSNLLWHLGSYQCFPVRYAYIVLWLGIVVVAKLYSEIIGEKDTEDTVVINGVEEDSSGLADTKSAKKLATILGICTIVVASLAELVFTLKNSLRFSYAFTTLEISKMKKETMLLYLLMLGIIAITTLCVTCFKKNKTIVNVMTVYLACLMGAIWFIAVLWPESMEARSTNEQNYVNLNAQYEVNIDKEFAGRIRENETQSLNSCLVSGAYSMSAYVPSGESLEYVTAMQKLGYETPWISVSETGGSELSDKLLGIEADYARAWLICQEDYNTLRNISDLLELLEDGEGSSDLSQSPLSAARKITFDDRRGSIKITSDSDMSGVLLLPMAYIDGWSSKQGTVEKYLEGLLSIDLLENTKEVYITHKVPGMMQGIILGIIGVLVLCAVTMISRTDTNYVNCKEKAKSKLRVISRLDIIASVCFGALSIAFIIIMYILPNIGMLAFMGAKATGNDWSPYIESRKATKESTHTLISENVTQDGIEVLIGKNNLMQKKGIKIVSSDDENASFRASKIADGLVDRENRWSSSNDHDNNEHYIQVDFKESKSIQAVNIFWERTNASHYYIEVSEDGNNWQVASEFSMPSQTNPQIIYYEDAISARYMRLHVDEVTKNEEDLSLYYQNVSVLELEVYDDECDNFVIDRPVIDNGTNRKVPVMDVPEGYLLKVGGINYDNLLTKDGHFVDNISDVDINLGYELYYGDEKWDLSGFDITLPAAVNDTNKGNNKQAFPFKNVNVQEWLPTDGNIDLTEYKAAIGEGKPCSIIDTRIDEKADYLGDEGYEIVIKNDAISVTAKTKRGLYWGSLTLKHMVAEKTELPCGIIRDYPEYSVRGFVLDVARRPIPMDELYRMLYELSDNYMNTFQIHLSDNEIIAMSDYDGTMEGAKALFSAFRLESDVQENGKTLTSQEFYYTDEEFSKFIADAKAIGVDVVPEIDTPAHALAITSIKPELGYDAAELADTLDISKSEVLDFATNLWAEYLEEDELFDECDVVHLGMDEFYGNSSDYVNYMSKLSSNIRGLAPAKTQRVWASLTYNDVNTAPLNRNIEMMIWNPVWSNPKKTYEDGFKVINCLNKHLYIIVDGGNDRLDVDDLATNWKPNQFVDDECDETIPAWSPRMLGACYSMWNDNYCSNEVKDCEDLYERFHEPLKVIAEKLW